MRRTWYSVTGEWLLRIATWILAIYLGFFLYSLDKRLKIQEYKNSDASYSKFAQKLYELKDLERKI